MRIYLGIYLSWRSNPLLQERQLLTFLWVPEERKTAAAVYVQARRLLRSVAVWCFGKDRHAVLG